MRPWVTVTSLVRSQLGRGVAWSFFGLATSRVLVLLSSVIVGRLLGQESFGALGVVTGTVNMFQAFAGFGLGLTASKYVAEYRSARTLQRVGLIVALSLAAATIVGGVSSAALLLTSRPLAANFLASSTLARTLQISSPSLFFGAISGTQAGILVGFQAFRSLAVVNVSGGIASILLMVAGAEYAGVDGAVAGLSCAGAVQVATGAVLLHLHMKGQRIPLSLSSARGEIAVLWSFSLPAMLSGLLVTPVNWACSAMLVNTPRGFAEMGILNATGQWFGAILFLPTVLGQVVLPLVSSKLGRSDKVGARRIFLAGIATNALIVVPIVSIGSALSPLIMGLYGPGYSQQWLSFALTLATAGILTIQISVFHVITASGRMWLGFWMNLGWALSVTAWLIGWGALGVVVGRLIAYGVHCIWVLAAAWVMYREVLLPADAHGEESA
jgi:O-antigen/teichoic acid export membrane protein